MSAVAHASLPVAIGLLILAAAARAALWAQIDDPRIPRLYLQPLSTWCLIAVGVHTLALGAAGDAGLGSLALPLGIGLAAVLLRPPGEPGEADEPEAAPAAPAPAPAPAEPRPASAGTLWARR